MSITSEVIDLAPDRPNHPLRSSGRSAVLAEQTRESTKYEGADMSFTSISKNLRCVLFVDAASCLICGAVQLAFSQSLTHVLGLPATLLVSTGEFLLLCAAGVASLATRTRAPSAVIWLLIVGNVTWGLASVAILLGGEWGPTLLGKGYVVAQALTVVVLAYLQSYFGLRQGAPISKSADLEIDPDGAQAGGQIIAQSRHRR
jgi:hypothetical protein